MNILDIKHSPTITPMAEGVDYIQAHWRKADAVQAFDYWITWISSQIVWLEGRVRWLAPMVAVLFALGVASAVLAFGLLSSGGRHDVVCVLVCSAVVNGVVALCCERLGMRFQRNVDSLQGLKRTLVKARDSVIAGSPFSLSFHIPSGGVDHA